MSHRILHPSADFDALIRQFMHQHVVANILGMLPMAQSIGIPHVSMTLIPSLLHLAGEKDVEFLIDYSKSIHPSSFNIQRCRDDFSSYLDNTHYTQLHTPSSAVYVAIQALIPNILNKHLDLIQHWEMMREFFLFQAALDSPNAPLHYLTMNQY